MATEEELKRFSSQLERLRGPLTEAVSQIDAIAGKTKEVTDAEKELENQRKSSVAIIDRLRSQGLQHAHALVKTSEGYRKAAAAQGKAALTEEQRIAAIRKANESTKQSAIELGNWAASLGGADSATGTAIAGIGAAVATFATIARFTTQAAIALGVSVGTIAAPIAIALAAIILLANIINQLFRGMKDAAGMTKTFAGTVFRSSSSIKTLTMNFAANRVAMEMFGVSAEDMNKTFQQLLPTYAMSRLQAIKLAGSMDAYRGATFKALIPTIAMGEAMGMSAEDTGKLVATFGLLGEDLRTSNQWFRLLAHRAEQAGVNMETLVKATTSLGSANIFATGSLNQTTKTLVGYAAAVMESNSALLTGANRAALAAKAMEGIAQASAAVDLPTMMAFGGALQGFTGTMDELLTQATKVPREEIMRRYAEAVSEKAPAGMKMVAGTLLAQQQGVQDLNTAIATSIAWSKGPQQEVTEEHLKEAERAAQTGKQLEHLAVAQNVLTNGILTTLKNILSAMPLAKLMQLINRIPGMGVGGAPAGPVPSARVFVPPGGKPVGQGMSTAVGR